MGSSVFIGLGSNIGLCSNNLENAIAAIAGHKGISIIQRSKVYETEPQEYPDQPWFCNQVILLDVLDCWSPSDLLKLLQGIENKMGRKRDAAKGPRLIDLDILAFGNQVIVQKALRIPHPAMKRRAFVLVPMMEICPDFIFPDGEKLRTVIGRIGYKVAGCRIYQHSG